MISFLISIERSGLINEIIWSDPAYLVSVHHHSFLTLFPEAEHELLMATIEKSMLQENSFECEKTLCLLGETSKIKLCMLPMDKLILVFAVDEKLLENVELKETYQVILHKFLETIKKYANSMLFHSNKATSLQFEKIQTLNNELINTRRLLEKANAQLNTLNEDLNNRLVKDALTGLVSRYQYRTEMEFFIAKNPGKLGIFTFIDIDNFKGVNDNYGHGAGDDFLVEFAARLRSLPLENTIKMRIAGDEFGLFTFGLAEAEAAQQKIIWQLIQQHVLAKPIAIDGKQLPLSISAGMAVYGRDTREIYELLEYADFAMYGAKNQGKNRFNSFDQTEYLRLKGTSYRD
ncbi:MAG: GGDEF domain-containing protein [Clostridia bacterium]